MSDLVYRERSGSLNGVRAGSVASRGGGGCRNGGGRRWRGAVLGRLVLVLGLWWGGVLPLAAVEVRDLYQAEIAVSGQSASEREQAIREALAVVLVKVTGNPDTPVSPAAQEILSVAAELVEQFRYTTRQIPNPDQDIAAFPGEPVPDTVPQEYLWVSFDRDAVNSRLAGSGFPIWGSTRPAVLVWLALELNGRRFLVELSQYPDIGDALMAAGKRRGVPVMFPLFDLEDQGRLSVTDVWGNFGDAIVNASRRYRAESILVGRVIRVDPSNWFGRWTLYVAGDALDWSSNAATIRGVLGAGINGAANALASRFALTASDESNNLMLRVAEVGSLQGYARVLKYLQSLDQVQSVLPVYVDHQTVSFRINYQGSSQVLEDTIAIGSVLAKIPLPRMTVALPDGPLDQENASREPKADMAYRLVR